MQPQDLLGLQIRHPGLDRPILIPFRPRFKLDAETILHHIEEVLQSNTKFLLDERMVWQTTKIRVPAGSAPKRKMTSNFVTWFEKKSGGHGGSLLKIENNDELCLARALVTAKCHLLRETSNEAQTLYTTVLRGDKNRCTRQKTLAQELMNEAGLTNHRGPCSLIELKRLHSTPSLRHYRVQVNIYIFLFICCIKKKNFVLFCFLGFFIRDNADSYL